MASVMVTVLMAVRDTPAEMLRQAIASIRQQTWRDFEFLILDDGSQQRDTLAELERQAAEEPRIRFELCAPCGLTRTLNRGLELAGGDVIARQDADDWSEPERLERQVAFLREHSGVGLCGTNAWTHRDDGRPLWPTRLPEDSLAIREALWQGNPFVHGSAMFRTTEARYREEFSCAQDYDFFWRLSDASGAANLAEPLYHYRYNRGAVSARRAAEQGRAHRAARVLAEARRSGDTENVGAALAAAEVQNDAEPLRAALKEIDHQLLAGDLRTAGRAYAELLLAHPDKGLAWGKLLRWAVYSSVPPAREWCFR